MLKVVAWLALTAAGVLFPLAVLAAYDVTGSSPPAPFHTGSGSEAPAYATVEIHPDTLNLKSHGRWITAYIELPQGLDVANIDVATVHLCLGQVTACPEDASVPAQTHPSGVGDYDHDGIPDRMVKFDRPRLVHLLGGQTGDVTMSVTGTVTPPGQAFAASDTIRVTDHGCGGAADAALCADEEAPEDAILPQATPTAEPTPVPEATASPAGEPTPAPAQTAEVSPPPPPPTPPPPDIPTVEYTVRPGERVADVAAFFGTTVDVVVALNGLANPNLVVPGQRLLVPAPPAATLAPAFTSEYVVQPGENLTDIAARFGTTVEALAAANSLANPSAILVGERLLVP